MPERQLLLAEGTLPMYYSVRGPRLHAACCEAAARIPREGQAGRQRAEHLTEAHLLLGIHSLGRMSKLK